MPDSDTPPTSVDLVPRKKLGDMRPCDTVSRKEPDVSKLGESVLIKPGKKTDMETMMLLNPCDTSSTKKRRLNQTLGDEFPAMNIQPGQPIDLKALLFSKDRDYLVSPKDGQMVPVSSLVGKHVLVCGFIVPFDTDSLEANTCQSLEALYSHLSHQGIADDVQLVVALIMLDSGSTQPTFDAFFSSLSVNCLAIPFFDSKSRHYVCESLGFTPDPPCLRDIPSLAVNPSGIVLMHDSCFLTNYGALAFPFAKERFHHIWRQDEIIKHRFRSSDSPMTLEQLLQCDRLSLISDENKSIPTSELRDTPVGLYLYFDGAFMDKLQDIHKRCLDKDYKFEIVLLPLPFKGHCDPASFYSVVKQSALKNCRSSSWWAFPLNEKICRTLWRLLYQCGEDQLIILPHGDCFGELYGKHVASYYGIDAYPFTRDAVVEKKVNELRSLTLARLLGDNYMAELHNKNVLLCVDDTTISSVPGYIYETLEKNYHEITLKYPGTEVVVVPLDYDPGSKIPLLSHMSWCILPPEMCESVVKHIYMTETYPNDPIKPALVAFGKDGKIVSRSAEKCLPISTTASAYASLFDDTLRSDILRDMDEEILELD